jgi:LuxR family maltose regulon positive regulatory protein
MAAHLETRPDRDLPSPARYAKLARPHVHDALSRERLFKLLDTLRDRHDLIWVAGPPGAGKTTLLTTYLDRQSGPAIWCQLDDADADPETLLYFLREAAQRGPRLQLVPHHGVDGRHIKQRLREFYAELPPGTVIVFDNGQEFDWNNAGALFETALSEVPGTCDVVVLSREAPPARLAKFELSGRLGTLGWDALRLTRDEALQLACLEQAPDAMQAAWLELVDGWAAGVVMLRSLPGVSEPPGRTAPSRDTVFRYFAGEVLDRMPTASQRSLILLSFLPGVAGDDAERLTGDTGVMPLLEHLYRNRLFTECRPGEPPTYHFHALFRDFLQHEAKSRLGADERQSFLRAAADLQAARGNIETAADLYQRSNAYAGLADLLTRHAELLLGTGRGQLWRDWMSALPPAFLDSDPWLWYWHGISLNDRAPRQARQILVRAVRAFEARGAHGALALTIAAIVDGYEADWSDSEEVRHWVTQLAEAAQAAGSALLEPVQQLRVYGRLVSALLSLDQDAPALARAARLAQQLLLQVASPTDQLACATALLRYAEWREDTDAANWLIAAMAGLAGAAGVGAQAAMHWRLAVAQWHITAGDDEQAAEGIAGMRAMAADFALDPVPLQFIEVRYLLRNGSLAPARVLLDQLRLSTSPARRSQTGELDLLNAYWHARSGDLDTAVEHAVRAADMLEEQALAVALGPRLHGFLGACHTARAEFDLARRHFELANAIARGRHRARVADAFELASAFMQVSGGDASATESLRSALRNQRQKGARTLFPLVPALASQLAASALERQIETDFVLEVIARQALTAPTRLAASWPWPIAIRTLGGFQISRLGVPVASKGKIQQRPLMLLKVLVGSGNGCVQQNTALQLWPDADNARSAMMVTVFRLRKLLDMEEGLTVTGGTIQLEPAHIWSDVEALNETTRRIESLGADAGLEELTTLSALLLAIYGGPFCEGDDDPWFLALREKWRQRFLRSVNKLGPLLEERHEWQLAIDLYQRAAEAEPIAETAYRGMMRCHHALGDPAAAFAALRRCRDTLSIVLGQGLSAETEKLAVELG